MGSTNDPFMGFPYAYPGVGEGSGHQSAQDEASTELRNEEADSSQYPDPELFINAYDWATNHLPIGFSFDSDYRIPTPDFMKGWTYEPPEEAQEDENQVVYMESRGTGYVEQLARGVRRSTRHIISPRIPFPNTKPASAMLATDFQSANTIPGDIRLWCPCCTQSLPGGYFKIAFTDQTPVETCIVCRRGQVMPPDGFLVCWSDHKGCGRLLPSSSFSGSHTHDTFTGVFCHDCRAFGHNRARFEGRYVETT